VVSGEAIAIASTVRYVARRAKGRGRRTGGAAAGNAPHPTASRFSCRWRDPATPIWVIARADPASCPVPLPQQLLLSGPLRFGGLRCDQGWKAGAGLNRLDGTRRLHAGCLGHGRASLSARWPPSDLAVNQLRGLKWSSIAMVQGEQAENRAKRSRSPAQPC